MSKPATKPSKLARVILPPVLLLWVVALSWFLSFNPSTRYLPPRVLFEAYALIAILFAFRCWPPMVRFILGMPIPHRVVFGLILTALIAGHFSINTRTYFPFVSWEIFPFVREEDPVVCRELIATTDKGQKVRLLVEQLFPSIVQFNFPADPDKLDRLVTVLVKAYNKTHAQDPVHNVDLVSMAVELHPPAGEWRPEPSCALLKHYDF